MAASRILSTWFRVLWGLAHDVEDCLMEFYLHLETPSRAAGAKHLLLPRPDIAKRMASLRSNIQQLNTTINNTIYSAIPHSQVFMGGSDIDLNADMTTQAKLVINKCDGHPLAITTVAGFLARKPKTAIEWKKLNDDLSVGSGTNPNLETICKALAPSYDDLPYELKKAILGEIEKLTKLHKLGLTGINMKNDKNVLCAIAKLTLLRSLSLRAEGKPGLQGCLDHDISLPKNLQSLKIYGTLVTLPTWITQLQHLSKIKLRSTQLELDFSMKVLGKLPHLAILRLWKDSFQGEEIIFNFHRGLFPSLVVLELSNLDALKSLSFMKGALPRLELLHVENCIHVESNGFSGMSFLPRLKEVTLKGDYNNKFVDNLRAQITHNQNRPILKGA
ncbi:hypothetical protein GUJ93_ZPchr0006g40951 [Zizania palustris]|uniref:Disease resistance R13L4/SHOC-2-like LRR domain-containing protein n=1 Tax=Zizania palustris TaxID=103762 RepID=A0A8J5W1K6_ZIZPA|nr:hypothetical protein GUJ93_ZPchr0006g40951 [Zizania palustris]